MIFAAVIAVLLAMIVLGAWTVSRTYSKRPPAPPIPVIVKGSFDRLAGRIMGGHDPSAEIVLASGRTRPIPLTPADGGDTSARRESARPPSTSAPEAGPWTDAVIASAPAMAYTAGAAYYSSLEVDGSLLNALEQLSGEQVETLADFEYVQSIKDYQLDSIKLRGTIGEQESAEAFGALGADVEWPGGGVTEFGASNNPGWDFMVDGHEVNVKVTQDAADAASEHFAEYPDIPIVVNADAANIPADAIHVGPGLDFDPADLIGDNIVIVQDALTLSGIEGIQQAAEGVEAVGEAVDSMGDVLPGLTFLTAAVTSSIREGRLLKDGKTDRERAIKNLLVDTGSKGGGAAAGAAAGLAVDAAFGGLLLGIPTIVGTIMGARAGGAVGNRIRLRPLWRAQEELRDQVAALERESVAATRRADQHMQTTLEAKQEETRHAARQAASAYGDYIEDLRAELWEAGYLTTAEARHLVRQQASQLHQTADVYAAELALAGPVTALLSRPEQRRLRSAIREWEIQAAQRAETVEQDGVAPLFDCLMATRQGTAIAIAFLHRMGLVQRSVEQRAIAGNQRLVATIVSLRHRAADDLLEERNATMERTRAQVTTAAAKVDASRRTMIRELEMAGQAAASST